MVGSCRSGCWFLKNSGLHSESKNDCQGNYEEKKVFGDALFHALQGRFIFCQKYYQYPCFSLPFSRKLKILNLPDTVGKLRIVENSNSEPLIAAIPSLPVFAQAY